MPYYPPASAAGNLTGDVTSSGGVSIIVNAASLPTSDPRVATQLWNDDGVVTLSRPTNALANLDGALHASVMELWLDARPQSAASGLSSNGAAVANVNPASTTLPTSTNITTRTLRTKFASTASAGINAGSSNTNIMWPNDKGVKGQFLFNLTADATGYQFFAGFRNSASILGQDPSTISNIIGVGYDAADVAGSNWQIIYNNAGTATRVDTGIPRTLNSLCRLILDNYSSTNWAYRFDDLGQGTSFSGTATSGTPAAYLGAQIGARNGAVAAATGHEAAGMFVKWMIQ